MLMEYFTFEELKGIKARVLHLHSVFSSVSMYGLLTKREVKMAGYWPHSFFACLCLSRSINTQKKNKANIKPSRPNKRGQ